jgi:hypothetical protein
VAPMLPILVSTPPVLLKCSGQLAVCMLIQPVASNMIMMLIGAPLLLSASSSITMQYKINLN